MSVYALFGYIWMKGLHEPEQGMGVHPNTVNIMMLWLVVCMTGMLGPIANAAHVMGLVGRRRPSVSFGISPGGRRKAASEMGSPRCYRRRPAAAVIGGGFIGPVHVEALRRIGVEVVGMLGSSPDRAREAARRLGIPRVYPTSANSWTMIGSGSSTWHRPMLTISTRPGACWSPAAM